MSLAVTTVKQTATTGREINISGCRRASSPPAPSPCVTATDWQCCPCAEELLSWGLVSSSTERRTRPAAPYPGSPALRERERKTTPYNATVMPCARTHARCHHCFPGLVPALRRGAKAGHAGERVRLQWGMWLPQGGSGRVPTLGSHLGHLPHVRRGQGATCQRAAPALEIAACLSLASHLWALSVGVFTCPDTLPHLLCRWEAQGTQEAPRCPPV